MMLRSKLKNVQVPVDNRQQKRKQDTLSLNKNPLEPAAKKSICEISTGIKAFAIDSTKRASRVNDENQKPEKETRVRTRVSAGSTIDPCPNYDYDREEAHNPESVADYASDIFKYYKSREAVFRIPDYLGNHPDLDTKTRAILVDWLVELQESFELNHETLYNAVKIVDMYLAKSKNVSKDKIQMVASAAIFIAAKYDERSPPLADDLIYLAGDRFDRSLLMAMERELFSTIEFDLGAPLSYRYLRRLARVTHSDMASLTLARYLLESSLLIYDYSMISASRVSCAAFLLAMRMKDNTYGWNPILMKYSGYTSDEIVPLTEHLNHSMHVVSTKWKQLSNIREKYSHEVFFKSALVPLLPDTLAEHHLFAPLPQMSFP